MVAQIKRIKKTKSNFFSRILLLGSSSPPSQLFPNPFNWSPNTVFYRYLNIGRSNKKKRLSTFLFKFCFWEDSTHPVNWSPTHSTGPQTLFFTVRPKAYFSKVYFPKVYFPKVYFPKVYFPKLYFPKVYLS